MNANIACARHTLHGHLKVPDVVMVEDVGNDGGCVGVLLVDGVGEIALQAAWIVSESGTIGHKTAVDQGQGDWAQVDAHVLEGP